MQSTDTSPPPARRAEPLIWLGLGLTLALLLLALLLALLKANFGMGAPLPNYGQVQNFTLTNQNGRAVSLADLRGHVWVADIIFTRCPGPCLKMTRQMKELQQALPPRADARLITLTTDPDFDVPSVLKAYADRFAADPARWWFLTGTKTEIGRLATDSLKLSALEKQTRERTSPTDLFIHSTIFVLVDKQGQLRGVFETTGEGVEPTHIRKQLLAGIRRLERER